MGALFSSSQDKQGKEQATGQTFTQGNLYNNPGLQAFLGTYGSAAGNLPGGPNAYTQAAAGQQMPAAASLAPGQQALTGIIGSQGANIPGAQAWSQQFMTPQYIQALQNSFNIQNARDQSGVMGQLAKSGASPAAGGSQAMVARNLAMTREQEAQNPVLANAMQQAAFKAADLSNQGVSNVMGSSTGLGALTGALTGATAGLGNLGNLLYQQQYVNPAQVAATYSSGWSPLGQIAGQTGNTASQGTSSSTTTTNPSLFNDIMNLGSLFSGGLGSGLGGMFGNMFGGGYGAPGGGAQMSGGQLLPRAFGGSVNGPGDYAGGGGLDGPQPHHHFAEKVRHAFHVFKGMQDDHKDAKAKGGRVDVPGLAAGGDPYAASYDYDRTPWLSGGFDAGITPPGPSRAAELGALGSTVGGARDRLLGDFPQWAGNPNTTDLGALGNGSISNGRIPEPLLTAADLANDGAGRPFAGAGLGEGEPPRFGDSNPLAAFASPGKLPEGPAVANGPPATAPPAAPGAQPGPATRAGEFPYPVYGDKVPPVNPWKALSADLAARTTNQWGESKYGDYANANRQLEIAAVQADNKRYLDALQAAKAPSEIQYHEALATNARNQTPESQLAMEKAKLDYQKQLALQTSQEDFRQKVQLFREWEQMEAQKRNEARGTPGAGDQGTPGMKTWAPPAPRAPIAPTPPPPTAAPPTPTGAPPTQQELEADSIKATPRRGAVGNPYAIGQPANPYPNRASASYGSHYKGSDGRIYVKGSISNTPVPGGRPVDVGAGNVVYEMPDTLYVPSSRRTQP